MSEKYTNLVRTKNGFPILYLRRLRNYYTLLRSAGVSPILIMMNPVVLPEEITTSRYTQGSTNNNKPYKMPSKEWMNSTERQIPELENLRLQGMSGNVIPDFRCSS